MPNRQSRSYPCLLLAALSAAYFFATLDRIVISLLVEPIKADLGLSDTEISLLLGVAFILLFSVAGLPMGFLVDRINRMRLLGAGVFVWSGMTALCGLANGFWSLFFARAGVGIGEAVLAPAGFSLISDAFEKRRLGLALGIFTMGGALGTGASLILGGYAISVLTDLGEVRLPVLGVLALWQLTFVLIAIPGVFLAIMFALMPGPMRKSGKNASAESGAIRAVLDFYRANSTLLALHHVATGMTSIVLYGGYSWVAPIFNRVHNWSPDDVGYAAGVVAMVVTPTGLLGGGALGDYLLRYGASLRLWVCAVSVACGAICALAYPLMADPYPALVFFGGMIMFATVPVGVGNAALQHVLPGDIRGRVSAVYFFSLSMIGMTGPTLIAGTSDLFFPFPSGIAVASAIVMPLALVVATVLWIRAVPLYRRMLDQTDNPNIEASSPAYGTETHVPDKSATSGKRI